MNINIPTSRDAARQLGSKIFLGNPCLRSHSGNRYTNNGRCVECCRNRTNEANRANPEKNRQKARNWRDTDPRRTMFFGAKKRAKEDGREFNLTIDDIVIPETCPVLGIPMMSPSLDRVDSSKGYVRGNVEVISWRANKLKSDATRDEIALLLSYIDKHQSSG